MLAVDYFLSNVKTVDDVSEERKWRLPGAPQWKAGLQTSVGTWPCFNVISDLPADEKWEKLCAARDKSQVYVRAQMYGQSYNSTSFEGCQPNLKGDSQKVSELLAVLDNIMIPLRGANLLRVVSHVLCIASSFRVVLYFLFLLTFIPLWICKVERDQRQEMTQAFEKIYCNFLIPSTHLWAKQRHKVFCEDLALKCVLLQNILLLVVWSSLSMLLLLHKILTLNVLLPHCSWGHPCNPYPVCCGFILEYTVHVHVHVIYFSGNLLQRYGNSRIKTIKGIQQHRV